MKFGIRAQNLKERIGLAFNLAPLPIVHSNLYAFCARALCDAVTLGVFQSIGTEQRSMQEIARATNLNESALEALLNLLVSMGYLVHRDGRFSATKLTTKWLLDDSESSISDGIRLFGSQWAQYEHLPHYLRTGEGFRTHLDGRGMDWSLYMRAMFQFARMGSKEIAKKTPIDARATAMIDVGGSHGLYSVELCRRIPTLRSVVLDLPPAVEAAAPILASINAEGRVEHRAGDILSDDIGTDAYDLVFMSNFVHNFSAEQNGEIAKKAARALKPGGHFVIQDFLRPAIDSASDTLSSVQNLFFSVTSRCGVHSLETQQAWQREAGLAPRGVVRFMTSPLVQVVAVK